MIALYLLRPVGHEVNVHVALGKKIAHLPIKILSLIIIMMQCSLGKYKMRINIFIFETYAQLTDSCAPAV